jgi:hypothetical protein
LECTALAKSYGRDGVSSHVLHLILQEIWQDLELSDVAKEQQLKDITERALGVWSGAVEHAENHRKGIRRRIDDAASEMRSIAELLGELAAIEDPNSSMVGPPSICEPSPTQSGSKQLQNVTASLSIPSFATVVALSCRALQDKFCIDARHLSYVVGTFVSVKTAALHILTYLQSCIVFNCAGVIAHQPRQDTQASV